MTGTEWRVESVVSVTDGDSLRVHRSRITQLGDDWYRIADVNPDGTLRSVPIRLTWVDTPERADKGYRQAHDDLAQWVSERRNLRIICHESAGWDRVLADLIDADGNSASQWLMTEANNGAGWPAYVKGK